MVYYEIVNRPVADDLAYILDILCEEIHLYGVNEAHFLVHNQVRVVAYSVGKWP